MQKEKKLTFHPIILGSDENAYGMARAFHMRYGIKPTLMCKLVLVPARYSKIVEIRRFDGFDEEEVFVKRLTETAEEKKALYDRLLLIPCSDSYTEMVCKNSALIEKYFANRFISRGLLETFATKEKFYALCEKYRLPFPKTEIVKKSELKNAGGRFSFGFPLVVKADNSNGREFMSSKFEGKKKVFFVENQAGYESLVKTLDSSGYEGKFIIQEFIPGGDSSMRVLNCYSDNSGRVRLMCMGRPVIEEYSPLNLGNYAAIMSENCIPLCYRLKEFLEEIKYTGFSNFDMKYDPASGEYKLFEINPRQGRSSFFVTAAGYNLAEYLTENTVYSNPLTAEAKDAAHLWLTVPKKILETYVADEKVKARIKELFKHKKFTYTLLYKKDMNPKRWAAMKLYINRHIKEYKKYYFKKEEFGNHNV